MELQVLHEALLRTLYPFGNEFRSAEAQLEQLELQPKFITGLLELLLEPSVDLAIRRAGAVYLKNKILRSWSLRSANPLNAEDKAIFKIQVIPATVNCHASLRDFLMVCVSKIMDYDFQNDQWPELLQETMKLLQETNNLQSITGGLVLLKQICKFYRWNISSVNIKLNPLLADVFPHVLQIAEAAIEALMRNDGDQAVQSAYYEMLYNVLKIYKLSTTRFLPDILRHPEVSKQTIGLFLRVFMLPLPEAVLSVQPSTERASLLPVKCQKWATANILRTHQTYLIKSYSQLNENAAKYAPYRQVVLKLYAPEITKMYIEKLKDWSTQQVWLSDAVLYNVVSYLDAMIDVKHVFSEIIEPQLEGLLGQVLFPLLYPSENDLDLFDDDPIEFVQRQGDFSEMLLTPSHAAADFINHTARKRKSTTPMMVEFLQQCAIRLADQQDAVKERVGLLSLLQALAQIYLAKTSEIGEQLEPFVVHHVIPDLVSAHAYLRYEACNTVSKLSSFKFASRDTTQKLFQGILGCFFDGANLPVQVAAALTVQSLSLQEFNTDIRVALGQHITEIIQNLLHITQQIDLESLLGVLDHLVEQFPERISPFAVELAAQLCRQFITLASDLGEAQRQAAASGDAGAVGEAELMMANDEKTAAGFGIMNSLANLQNNLENQREITARLDEQIGPVFLAVYQNELTDFYPDCLSLHENTLFTLKVVPEHHWQFFELLLGIIERTGTQNFEDAVPVLENYILYGAKYLAQNRAALSKFTTLLVNLYAPSNGDDEGASASFALAQTRSHVMSVTTKLLVSSELFNGPLTAEIPKIVGALISRVSEDGQKNTPFPPRYNVSAVSVILAGLYHDPGSTLLELHRTGSINSFLETWFQTVPEFTRINDLKLCVVAVLSLLSYQLVHPEFELTTLPQLLQTLTKGLEALPGAASRAAEYLNNDADGLWDDEIYDELEEEEDEEFETTGELDAATNDASAEFEDQMPESSAATTSDGTFYYEQPGGPAAEKSGDNEENEAARAELKSALISQMGFIADDFNEDVYSVSPLDDLNPYDALRAVLSGMQATKPDYYMGLINTMPENEKAILNESLQLKSLPNYSAGTAK